MVIPGLGDLPIFPCSEDKRPLAKAWQSAKQIEPPSHWPLIGVPTGFAFDVLDIDPEGLAWFDAVHLPLTRMHQSPRGLHLLFRSAGLRSSASRIAQGVDVRAEGGYVIFWPRQGLPVCEAPIADWPEELLGLGRSNRLLPQKSVSVDKCASQSTLAHEALATLDPCAYRNHDDWLRVMMACHASGIACEDFIAWSTRDPRYADAGDDIHRRWASLKADGGVTSRALFVEARMARLGDKTSYALHPLMWQHPLIAPASPTHNLQHRTSSILRTVKDEASLFWAACRMREIIAEGRIKPHVAVALLENTGIKDARRTIASAFLTVETAIGDRFQKANLEIEP